MNIIKRLVCTIGLCSGHIEHFCDDDGVWWVGLKCNNGRFHLPIRSKFQNDQTVLKVHSAK